MRQILKRKVRRSNYEGGSDSDANETKYIDFNNYGKGENAFEKKLSIELDEDLISFATWMHLHHPNFFDGDIRAFLRFFMWLTYALASISMQIFTLLQIDDQVI